MARNGRRKDGVLIVNDISNAIRAAKPGYGPAFVMEDQVNAGLTEDNLVRLLADWCPPLLGITFTIPTGTIFRQLSSRF